MGEGGGGMVPCCRAQAATRGGGTVHLVDSIRPVLSFQAESRVLGVCSSTFALQGAVQVVPGVKLDARLGGVNLHSPAGGWVASPGEMPVAMSRGWLTGCPQLQG